MEQVLSIDTIVSNPEIRSGRPVIAGTGITVSNIVIFYEKWEMSPQEITKQLGVSLADVHAALAYYYSHKAEIDAEIENSNRAAQTLRGQIDREQD
ncbi:MAG: DUF433 domain-containing protein [Anaerolineae bacterium]|nr:DUF433 domain-containing protein [Anaerolineae bacterium]